MPDTRIASMQPLTGASFAFQSINRANPKAIFSTIHPPFRTLFSDFTHFSICHTFNPNSPSCAWACACEERFRLHMTTQSKPLERCGALRRRAARGLFHQKFAKISKIHYFLTKNSKKSANFEFGAVQRWFSMVFPLRLQRCKGVFIL